MKMAKTITVDLPDKHQEILEQYCEVSDQSQTAVIKELIFTVLKQRLKALKTE
jgi:predicted transcriptional regulator